MRGAWKRIGIAAALAAVGVGLAAWAGVGRPEVATGGTAEAGPAVGITVTGVGTVEAPPDQAHFSFGVETQGDSADAALAANSDAVQRVIDAVKGAGIADEDVRTQQVSVYPRYAEDGQAIVGYTASNTVGVTIDDLAKVGDVVDAATQAGANQVSGPSLSIAVQDELVKEALADAFADARSKAEAVAAAAGVGVGRVLSIVEGGAVSPPIPYAADVAAAEGAVPIEPGLQEVTATVSVTFAIG